MHEVAAQQQRARHINLQRPLSSCGPTLRLRMEMRVTGARRIQKGTEGRGGEKAQSAEVGDGEGGG